MAKDMTRVERQPRPVKLRDGDVIQASFYNLAGSAAVQAQCRVADCRERSMRGSEWCQKHDAEHAVRVTIHAINPERSNTDLLA